MASLDIILYPFRLYYYRVWCILDESSYYLMYIYGGHVDTKMLNGKTQAYHFAVVRVESLVDQGELFTAKATLQIQQMAKHPRLVLSSRNHYQLTVS